MDNISDCLSKCVEKFDADGDICLNKDVNSRSPLSTFSGPDMAERTFFFLLLVCLQMKHTKSDKIFLTPGEG
jgi:hypothetical protein